MARILLIDDDPDIRFVAKLALKRGKHEVVAAESGRAALEFFDGGGDCDLVICDRMMPEMTGLQTLEELQRRPAAAATPFVFLTAKAQKNEIDEGLRMGACRYLTKPFEPADLLEQVNRILSGESA
jgi:CheY-like chemotaxis protein